MDVLITDLDMPGQMDGWDLAAQVSEEHPEIAQVATSGTRHIPDADLPDGGVFLPKPYEASNLIGTVQHQLEAGKERP